jgi:hypothetical protein
MKRCLMTEMRMRSTSKDGVFHLLIGQLHGISLIDRISGHFLKMSRFLDNLIDTRSFDAGCIVASSNVWVVVYTALVGY